MDRRAFISGITVGLLAAPLAAEARQDLKDAGEKLATLHQAPVKKGKVTQLRPR